MVEPAEDLGGREAKSTFSVGMLTGPEKLAKKLRPNKHEYLPWVRNFGHFDVWWVSHLPSGTSDNGKRRERECTTSKADRQRDPRSVAPQISAGPPPWNLRYGFGGSSAAKTILRGLHGSAWRI